MRQRSRRRIFTLACLLILASSALPALSQAPDPAAKSAVTTLDLVREVLIGDPFSTGWYDSARRQHVSVTSPDSKHVAVVLRWGDTDMDTNVGVLLVYETSELFHSSKPRRVAEFASRSGQQPIALVRWLSDNRSLIFAGTDGELPTQVYQANIERSVADPLTNEPTAVEWYDVTPSGHRLITISKAVAGERPNEDPDCRKAGCLVTAPNLWEAQAGLKEGSGVMTVYDLEAGARMTLSSSQSSDPKIESCPSELVGGLSPDGRFGVRACMLKAGGWPKWWHTYDADRSLSAFLSKNNNSYALRLLITDFKNGETKALTDAPYIWDQPPPIWLDDGRHLLLVGALETLENVTKAETERRKSARSILLFDPETRSYDRVHQLSSEIYSITQSSWDKDSQILSLQTANAAGNPLPSTHLRRAGKRWVIVSSTQPTSINPETKVPHLVLHEALNTPATLVAVDPLSGLRKVVLDPNPWLAERQLGRVEEISWMLKNGQKWRGGLYYPPDHVPGKQYPLVILTHGFSSDNFSLHGYSRNFAAQPLAAHGMFILQVEEKLKSVVGTSEEWPTVQAGYEAAIDHLDSLGLIDRSRVGIHGWSRTGMHVAYTLTHSSYPFAAGALTSTGGLGWWWYIAAGAEPGYEADYGTSPFGVGLDVWQRISPSFNLDRTGTPMFMWEDSNVAGLWDWYVGLRRFSVPVEYWFLPEGTHEVFKVGERLLTCQLLVDWFRFWLKDEEDPDPVKAEQYGRWRKLRQQWNMHRGSKR